MTSGDSGVSFVTSISMVAIFAILFIREVISGNFELREKKCE